MNKGQRTVYPRLMKMVEVSIKNKIKKSTIWAVQAIYLFTVPAVFLQEQSQKNEIIWASSIYETYGPGR
jgi:hypothetical protein